MSTTEAPPQPPTPGREPENEQPLELQPLRRRRRWPWYVLAAVAVVVAITAAILLTLGIRTTVTPIAQAAPCFAELAEAADPVAVERARKRLDELRPRGRYIVIDSHRNQLRVFDNGTMLLDAVCSTGSGTVLVHPSGKKVWTFDTPLGERRVIRKVRNPVWSKPDWAFIEEGFQPPKDPSLRIDSMSLGDYALYLGDGYIIHGTLFQTLLGQGVTHGCVRLGDEDLEYVYGAIPVGARVYLY
jgi:L,D-transpeptidase YbiS